MLKRRDGSITRVRRRRPETGEPTGLISPSHVELLIRMEVARARRYGGHVSLVVLPPMISTPSTLRVADVSGFDRRGRVVLVLPNTDREGAARVAERAGATLEGVVAARIVTFPTDALTVGTLMEALG
jgi:hypothetical protein